MQEPLKIKEIRYKEYHGSTDVTLRKTLHVSRTGAEESGGLSKPR